MIITRTVYWFDPGAPSGWASVRASDWKFESGELDMTALGDKLRREMRSIDAIGMEGYTIRPGTSRISKDTSASETIGMLKWLAYYYNVPIIGETQPSARTLGALHLKTLGWYKPGLEDANSAGAHLLSWLLTSHSLPSRLLDKILHVLDNDSEEATAHDDSDASTVLATQPTGKRPPRSSLFVRHRRNSGADT